MLFLPEGSVKQALNNSHAVITYTCKSMFRVLTGDDAGCVIS